MTIIEQINQGIKDAMRSKDQLRLDTLRMLKSKILAADARSNLTDEEVIKLFKTYFGNLQEALEQVKNANRFDVADKLEGELAIVQEFLPQAPSFEETKMLVEQAIHTLGAKSKKELGLVMKAVLQLNKSVDGKIAKEIAFSMLAD